MEIDESGPRATEILSQLQAIEDANETALPDAIESWNSHLAAYLGMVLPAEVLADAARIAAIIAGPRALTGRELPPWTPCVICLQPLAVHYAGTAPGLDADQQEVIEYLERTALQYCAECEARFQTLHSITPSDASREADTLQSQIAATNTDQSLLGQFFSLLQNT
jgi:hypothetical protein